MLLNVMADSPLLFYVLTEPNWTFEKRLLNDLQTMKDVYKSLSVSGAPPVNSEYDNADTLAK